MGRTFPETYAEFEIVAREADGLAVRLAADMHNTVCQTRRLIAGSRELMARVDLAMARNRSIADRGPARAAPSIGSSLADRSFDPETIEVLSASYLAVCADLGLSDEDDRATEIVAKRVLELAINHRDAPRLRAAVLATFESAR